MARDRRKDPDPPRRLTVVSTHPSPPKGGGRGGWELDDADETAATPPPVGVPAQGSHPAGVDRHDAPDPPDARVLPPIPPDDDYGTGQFYVWKAGFTRDGELTLTIVFPKPWEHVGLGLKDKSDRMLEADFHLPRVKPKRTKTDEEVRQWYLDNYGTDQGSHNGNGS